jgi:hypothetical protein
MTMDAANSMTMVSAPPMLLAVARAAPKMFRSLTIEALMKAGYHGSASAVNRGLWPVGMWSTICAAATLDYDDHRRHAELATAARDHLAALATVEGVRFERRDDVEEWVVVDADGQVLGDDKVVGS